MFRGSHRFWRLFAGFASSTAAFGQASPASSEFWPEIQIYAPLTNSTQILGVASTHNNQDDPYSEVKLGAYLQADLHRFKPVLFRRISDVNDPREKRLSVRVGYSFHASFDTAPPKREHRLEAQDMVRWSFPLGILNSNRNRFEFRFVNGAYSFRFRDEWQVERDFRILGKPVSVYVSAEGFFDSKYNTISRWRYRGGFVVPLGKLRSLEPYYTRQKSRAPPQPVLNAAGLTLSIYLP